MTESVSTAGARTRSGGAGSALPLPVGFEGSLLALSALELLQSLAYLRKSGRILFEGIDRFGEERRALVELCAGSVVRARAGHLEGTEALLSLVWWKEGGFQFRLEPGSCKEPRSVPLQEVLLEAVRLADEVEELSRFVPEPGLPLLFQEGSLPEDLQALPVVQELRQALRQQPGLTRFLLERRLPWAPLRVAHAIARLRQSNRVRVDLDSSAARLALSRSEAARSTRLVRAAVAFLPEAVQEVRDGVMGFQWVESGSLGSFACDASELSFYRTLTRDGIKVSLVLVPLLAHQRLVFQSTMARLASAVVFVASDSEARLLESWIALLPKDQPRDVATSADWLTEHLRRLVEAARRT